MRTVTSSSSSPTITFLIYRAGWGGEGAKREGRGGDGHDFSRAMNGCYAGKYFAEIHSKHRSRPPTLTTLTLATEPRRHLRKEK